MKNKPTIQEQIDKCMERGVSDSVIRAMLFELYNADIIRFDDAGNPYWDSCGERLDGEEELVFND
jgi:hypothetical protein